MVAELPPMLATGKAEQMLPLMEVMISKWQQIRELLSSFQLMLSRSERPGS